MTPEEERYYAGHSAGSDPRDLSRILDSLPDDPKGLLEAVGGLVLHKAFVGPAGIVCPPDSADDAESRTIPEMLRRILSREPNPLNQTRPPEKRLIGVCRHYAFLACSAFRHQGRPSRLRIGFADYFESGYWEDHWVTEYWDEKDWHLMDPELTPFVRRHFGISFDPCRVPRDRFLTAGSAWLGIRSGRIEPAKCGLSTLGIAGAWFAAASVVRDLAALNKREMLPWDCWGITRDLGPGVPLMEETTTRIDSLAGLIAGRNPDWQVIRQVYDREEAFQVPSVILSFPQGLPIEMRFED